jgi:hypothetical protein
MAQTPSRRLLLALASLSPIAAFPVIAPALVVRNPDADPDAEIIALVDEIAASHAETDRLHLEWDESGPGRTASTRFMEEVIWPAVQDNWDRRAQLAGMQAVTLDGLRAKARVVRTFSNCSDGPVSGYDDDAVAFSLANDLLGRPTVLNDEEEDGDEGEEA